MKIKLAPFNYHTEKGKQVAEMDCETFSEAQEQKDKLEGFVFGDDDKFKTKEEIKKHLSERSVHQALFKLKNKVVKRFSQGDQLINFLNKFSVYISWDIEEID